MCRSQKKPPDLGPALRPTAGRGVGTRQGDSLLGTRVLSPPQCHGITPQPVTVPDEIACHHSRSIFGPLGSENMQRNYC